MQHGLHFDQSRRTGVVFHMISCLTECGRIGMTAVGDSPEDARRIYEEAQSVLLARGGCGARGRSRHRLSPRLGTDDPVWYVAYGSNLSARRFACYVSGGRPRGGSRTYLGCRDRTPPRRDVGIRLAGGVTFAGSPRCGAGAWPSTTLHADGEMAARAYLLTFGQLSDVVAQEAGD